MKRSSLGMSGMMGLLVARLGGESDSGPLGMLMSADPKGIEKFLEMVDDVGDGDVCDCLDCQMRRALIASMGGFSSGISTGLKRP